LAVPAQDPLPSQVEVTSVLPEQLVPQFFPATATRQAPEPLHHPSVPQALPSALHSLSGSSPSRIGAQTPSAAPVLARAQASQVPLQARSQQTPSTHRLDPHSVADPQAAPLARLPPHLPSTQVTPAAQSPLPVQVLRQPEAVQPYEPQDELLAGAQVPLPSQAGAAANLPASHDAVPQVVPAMRLRQAPAPSQVPSLPQPLGMSAVQSVSGSSPAGTDAQVPSAFLFLAALHATQVPLHSLLQQTPSTQ
jgi:hypothetical protein